MIKGIRMLEELTKEELRELYIEATMENSKYYI